MTEDDESRLPSAVRRWSASFRLALTQTRPRGDWKLPTRQAEKRTKKCRIRADSVTPALHESYPPRIPPLCRASSDVFRRPRYF